uniref:Cytochrome c oxidase subunit 5B, mitochondrial-like n=1 Tax=Sinocyclocheilus rhinocerous TaxID=307959 RepID=A0A673GHN1_9TELE
MASKILLRGCRLTLMGRQHILMKTPQRAMAGKGIPTDEEQAAGLERRILQAMKKGQDPYSIFKPKEYTGTRDDPHIVPSINNKRLVGCLCKFLHFGLNLKVLFSFLRVLISFFLSKFRVSQFMVATSFQTIH